MYVCISIFIKSLVNSVVILIYLLYIIVSTCIFVLTSRSCWRRDDDNGQSTNTGF